MAEVKINGALRIMDGTTSLRTLKEINTAITTLNTAITTLKTLLPVSLYENTSGENGDITLSETAANFNLIDIMYAKGETFQSVRVWSPNGKSVSLIMGYKMSDTDTQIQTPCIKINGTKLTKTSKGGVNLGTGGTVNGFTANEVRIYKVVGYKVTI